jgi:glucose-6-phosphate isomerase
MPFSIQFDAANLAQAAVGPVHGFDVAQTLAAHAPAVAKAVTELYGSRHTEGAWTKWLNMGNNPELADEIEAYVSQIKGQYDDLVILGIGGSSLGGLALFKALLHPYWNQLSAEQRKGFPRFHFVDNVDADVVAGLADVLDLKRTLINVISKSGTTAETMAAFLYFKGKIDAELGPEVLPKANFVFTTDKNAGILRQLADELNVPSFEVPDDVGGRFSIFSAVGLLPAAICGLNVRAFQEGIVDAEAVLSNPDITANPAAQNALFQVLMLQAGKPISVLMPYSTRLSAVADWYVQLWAESLGKAHDKQGNVINVGPTPLKAVGATDQHSQVQLYNEGPFDKVFTFVAVETPDHNTMIADSLPQAESLAYLANQPFHKLLMAEFEATRASVTHNQRPNVTLTLPAITEGTFAQLLYFLEVQTAIAGALLNIDPFDQPGVELAKQYTHALMGRKGYEHLVAKIRGGGGVAVAAV